MLSGSSTVLRIDRHQIITYDIQKIPTKPEILISRCLQVSHSSAAVVVIVAVVAVVAVVLHLRTAIRRRVLRPVRYQGSPSTRLPARLPAS